MDATKIRATFLDFFKNAGHEVVPSSSLIPSNDPTLMFTNAGMVPFKNLFTGTETRPYKRATSSQKCVRAGGKHNDLENVGYTARHHTFFEMLGNFSFGDYFKEEAIHLAWTLLTQEYRIDTKRLLVTYYAEDRETAALWKKIAGLTDDRIIAIDTKDNFWSMGDTGPCGPCTEIFYDHGEHVAGGPPGSADQDGDRFVEIWNLVFMQYEQLADGSRINLPKPCVDTGMGLERITAVLQGTFDNYDTNILRQLILASARLTKTDADGDFAVSHRVIADHLRASCFLIADGVLPTNEGRGYVLRRIMRRAMRHAHLTGYDGLLMYQLVPTLIHSMGETYPELMRSQHLIEDTLRNEEARFKRTLSRGLKLLQEETEHLKTGEKLAGDVAFKLYDTFGFPLDLTQDALKAKSIQVDTDGFHDHMAKQQAAARLSWKGSGDTAESALWFDLRETFGATEFLGYVQEVAEGKILALVQQGQSVKKVQEGDEVSFITNQTPFYAESGGQMGDTGAAFKEGLQVSIEDTFKVAQDLFVHRGRVVQGVLKVGDILEMRVDGARRCAIKANHSATHLLHAALREKLGTSVVQRGSLVSPDKLRFDFSYGQKLTPQDILDIEDSVNRQVLANKPTRVRVMPYTDALDAGAMALFGEKYQDDVRVVEIGDSYSVELCGGTHVQATGDIGLFKITAEASVSAGVRRIEAVTGQGAIDYIRERDQILDRLAALLKSTAEGIESKVQALLESRKKLEKDMNNLRQSGAGASAQILEGTAHNAPYKIMIQEGIPPKDLRYLMDQAKQQMPEGIVLILSSFEGKAAAILGVFGAQLQGILPASGLIKVVSEALGSQGGGGRPDMAQCGGPTADLILDAAKIFEQRLKDG